MSAPDEPQSMEAAEGTVGQESIVTQCLLGRLPSLRDKCCRPRRPHQLRRGIPISWSSPWTCHSCLDSWLANYYLDMITQIYQDPVHPDFSIYGSDLLVQMHYVDADFLQVSVTFLVYQLTLLMFASRSDTSCPWQAPSSMWGLAASSKNYLLCS